MDTQLILTIIGAAVGIAGLVFAWRQSTERRKFEKYVRSQNWHLYAKANNATGATQRSLALYKQSAGGSPNADVIEWLSKADAFGQDVFKDVIRQIQVSEPVFNASSISRWVDEDRINEQHAALFRNIASDI